VEDAYCYLARSVANSARKVVRGSTRRHRGLPPARQLDGGDHPVDRAVAETGDPAELLLLAEELASDLTELAELPAEMREVLIARAADYSPAEIQAAMGLSSRQYRKRVQKARSRILG